MSTPNEFLLSDDCIYSGVHVISFVTPKIKCKKHFQLIVYLQHMNCKIIKFLLIAIEQEELTFTAVFSEQSYNTLRSSQSLCIDYDDFPKQLRTILDDVNQGKITIKLQNNGLSVFELGFYSQTTMKEVSLLSIALECTPPEEIVDFYKKKARFYKEKYDHIHADFQKVAQMNQQLQIETKHKIQVMEQDQEQVVFNLENALRSAQNSHCEERDMWKREKEKFEMTISELNSNISSQNKEMHELHRRNQGLQHHCTQMRNALSLQFHKKRDEIINPIMQRYHYLKAVFANTVMMMVKNKMFLHQVLNMNELHKEENKRLRSDITECIDTINNMRGEMAAVDENEKFLQSMLEENSEIASSLNELESRISSLNVSPSG